MKTLKTCFVLSLNLMLFLSCDNSDKEYYPGGKIKVKYSKDKNDKLEQAISYYENGKEKSIIKYINGLENRETRSFYESGKLRSIGFYKDGKENGNWKYYYENGIIESDIESKDGKINGLVKKYFQNGSLQEISYRFNGDSIAFLEKYDEKNNLSDIKRNLMILCPDTVFSHEGINITILISNAVDTIKDISLTLYFIIGSDNKTSKVLEIHPAHTEINLPIKKVPLNTRAVYIFLDEKRNGKTFYFTASKEIKVLK